MAKFYVQSGTLRTVVEASSSRRAAMWAVHQAMQQILPIDDAAEQSPRAKSTTARDEGVAVLASTVEVRQNSFASPARVKLSTMEVVSEWNEMCETLGRLERLVGQSVAA